MFVIVCVTTFYGDDAEVTGVYGVYPSQAEADAACERMNADERAANSWGSRYENHYAVEAVQPPVAA